MDAVLPSCIRFAAIAVLTLASHAAAALTFAPPSFTFPTTQFDEAVNGVVRLTNPTAHAFAVEFRLTNTSCSGGLGVPPQHCGEEIGEELGSYTVSGCASLGPGESCDVQVVFKPRAARRLHVRLQATGFIFSATADLIGTGTPKPLSAGSLLTVEYFRASSDTYFYTYLPNEIAALDAGTFEGWTRTGYSFLVEPQVTGTSTESVCRFYGNPAFGLTSHFFSVFEFECAALQSGSGAWIFESPSIFKAGVPALEDGACAGDALPILRLFNNRYPAAHRFMTRLSSTYFRLIVQDWAPEGYGPKGVAMCVAPQVISIYN